MSDPPSADDGSPPPGWYQDPDRAHLERRWDGSQWTDQTRPRVQPSSSASGDEERDKKGEEQADDERTGCLALVSVAFVLAVLIGVCTTVFGDDERDGSPQSDRRFAVQSVCEDFVKDRLKAPATAGFPLNSDWTINQTADTWTARSHVDAQNSFGAQVRTQFTCTVRHVQGARWRLVSLDMES